MESKITMEELRFLSVFQELTGVTAYRCFIDEESNRLIYLVNNNEVGRAVGRNGKNVKLLARILKRSIEVVGYSQDLEQMTRNLFPGIRVQGVTVSERGGEKTVYVKVIEEDKGKAIGKDGRNVKRARLVLERLFGVRRVIVR
ncbi:MAG: NusA-like transcription termination signal-binding factor [Desulfurococcales archaeon]|nr:NusA-like transcription termination signal-binding factor [Desulfurococcales archaeon]